MGKKLIEGSQVFCVDRGTLVSGTLVGMDSDPNDMPEAWKPKPGAALCFVRYDTPLGGYEGPVPLDESHVFSTYAGADVLWKAERNYLKPRPRTLEPGFH